MKALNWNFFNFDNLPTNIVPPAIKPLADISLSINE